VVEESPFVSLFRLFRILSSKIYADYESDQ
jgi:hypothetical protein